MDEITAEDTPEQIPTKPTRRLLAAGFQGACLIVIFVNFFWHPGTIWLGLLFAGCMWFITASVTSSWYASPDGQRWVQHQFWLQEMDRLAVIEARRNYVINEYREQVGDPNAEVHPTYIAMRMNEIQNEQTAQQQHNEDMTQRAFIAGAQMGQQHHNHQQDMKVLDPENKHHFW